MLQVIRKNMYVFLAMMMVPVFGNAASSLIAEVVQNAQFLNMVKFGLFIALVYAVYELFKAVKDGNDMLKPGAAAGVLAYLLFDLQNVLDLLTPSK